MPSKHPCHTTFLIAYEGLSQRPSRSPYEFQKPLDPLDVDAIIREMTGFRPDHHMAQAA